MASQRPNSYTVYSKDTHEINGYLVGSIHSNLNEKELEPWNRKISEILNTQCISHIFVEAFVGHWTTLSFGLEDPVTSREVS